MRPFLRSQSALRSTVRASRVFPACRTLRPFSVKAEAAQATKQAGIDPKKLSITKTSSPRQISKPEDLVFGKEFTGKSV